MGLERRGRVRWSCFAEQLDDRMTSIDTTNKPFMIEKRQVYEAYKAVKSNKGVAGVDGQTIEQFEAERVAARGLLLNQRRMPSQ